jgi:hypothetical protein
MSGNPTSNRMQKRAHRAFHECYRNRREQNRAASTLFQAGMPCSGAKGTYMSETLKRGWRSFWTNGRNLRTGWLITAGIVALYVGVIRPYEGARGINNSRATGLAAERAEPIGLWRQTRIVPQRRALQDRESDADKFVAEPKNLMMVSLSQLAPPPAAPQDADDDRKMVRTSSIDLVVQKPGEAAEKIRTLAQDLGGFLVSSQVSGGQASTNGSLTIRVPAARFEEARAGIRKLGLRVESERIEAQDVTRQYVDQEANLRNLRAAEAQYLAILKQARTVKDTLEVSEKLSGVRGQIEQQQAEFEALSKQIETVAITISLQAEAEARVFGLNWRPLYQMKLALRDGLDGLATYASTMTAIVFFLPTIVLWLATILVSAAVSWRVLRWVGRRAFATKLPATAPQG